MTKSTKIVLGILSALPLAGLVVYLLLFFSIFTNIIVASRHNDEMSPGFIKDMLYIVIAIIAMMLISITLMIIFIINCINNPYVRSDERIVWILLFIFLQIIALPIYWYMRIWNTPHKIPGEAI